MFDAACLASLDRLDAALQELLDVDVVALPSEALSEVFRRLEAVSRRRDAVEHRVVAEIDQRGVAFSAGCRSVPAFLRALVTITPAEATRRHDAACALGPGRTFAGEATGPVYAQTAAAQAAGELSAAHARVITRMIDKLPDAVTAQYDTQIEADLVRDASVLDPRQLSVAARRLAFYYDQDGVLADEAYRERHRTLTVAQRADGSAHIDGELTAPCAEALLTVLDSLAKPAPATDGTRDPRTPGERRHDGLLDGLNRLLRDGGLSATGGVQATILLTIDETQLRHDVDVLTGTDPADSVESATDSGLARLFGSPFDPFTATIDTPPGIPPENPPAPPMNHPPNSRIVTTGHGALISLAQALQIATDAEIVPIVFGHAREITAYGSAQRIATPAQRLALAARDGGCCFPGCDVPPAWTEAHHVIEFQYGGKTSPDNLCLLCGYHHREFAKLGWTVTMHNGQPHWTPPTWLDPTQQTRTNTGHV